MTSTPVWRDRDGAPIACREKLTVLEENARELRQVMRDTFEDAVLMGVAETAVRAWMTEEVAALASPRR